MSKNNLWKVPAFCAAAGIISFNLIILLLSRFVLVTNPDGSVETDPTRVLILYASIFAVTVALGALLFRKMTRREIFVSASVMVSLGVVIQILNQLHRLSVDILR